MAHVFLQSCIRGACKKSLHRFAFCSHMMNSEAVGKPKNERRTDGVDSQLLIAITVMFTKNLLIKH